MEQRGKLHIVNESDGSHVPFLRGILTRSLQKAGLSFDRAYEVASDIRKELAGRGGFTSPVLRQEVGKYLRVHGFAEFVDSYLNQQAEQPQIRVFTSDGTGSPFSKGLMADSLEICALPREQIYEVVTAIESEFIAQDRNEVTSAEITERILFLLNTKLGPEAAEAYRRWIDFVDSGRPLILLVGGTTGSGKSSISSELAHRLDIVRTQSTDMLREVMRLMVPERLLPSLHTSSFLAYHTLPTSGLGKDSEADDMISGYLTQSSQIGVGIEGVLKRTENEQVSLILEGVHIHPQLMNQIGRDMDALVVPVILAVLKPKRLKKRLLGRGRHITSRKSERYLASFDKIWDLQSFLLSQGDLYNIPIIPNDEEEETVRLVMQTVSAYLKADTSS